MLKVLLAVLLASRVELSTGRTLRTIPNEQLFMPCPGEEGDFLDKYVDLSKLVVKRVDDDTAYVNGTFQFKDKFKNAPIKVVYTISNDASMDLENFPQGKMAGEYRAIVRAQCADAKTCFLVYGEIIEVD